MCKACVFDAFPVRNQICLDGGSYMLNFKACAECKDRSIVKIMNKNIEQVEDYEKITYQHVCSSCDHLIAEHEYNFTVVDFEQEYEMNCILCGTGQDHVDAFHPK